jgi:hypothetical protein
MFLSRHPVQYTCHGNKSTSQAAHNCPRTREHTVRGLIRSRESASRNQNSCIAVAAHVRNPKRDQIPSNSKHKTNDRDFQRSEYWRFGVVGHADSIRTNAARHPVAASDVSKSQSTRSATWVDVIVIWSWTRLPR